MRKVEIATIIGTLQSGLTNFKYLSRDWKKNCEDERLLGVSLTGILDHPTLAWNTEWLETLKGVAVATNEKWASRLGIEPSAAVTCVKPSGTVSQLVNSSSGCHPRHSQYYIRRVRMDSTDPLNAALKEIPHHEDPYNAKALVYEFPVKAPVGARTRHMLSALEHLEIYKNLSEHWAEHSVSVTISVKEDEWLDVGAWVYEHFDICKGLSFLPSADEAHSYQSAPYEDTDEITYRRMESGMPDEIQWSHVVEEEDNTVGSQELACTAGMCEVA